MQTLTAVNVLFQDPGQNGGQHSSSMAIGFDVSARDQAIDVIWHDPRDAAHPESVVLLTGIPPFTFAGAQAGTQTYPAWMATADTSTGVGEPATILLAQDVAIPGVILAKNNTTWVADVLSHDPADTANPRSYRVWTGLPVFDFAKNDAGTEPYPCWGPVVPILPCSG